MNKQFIISEELAQNILNYLASQPYTNVFNLVAGMQDLKPYEKRAEVADQVAKEDKKK